MEFFTKKKICLFCLVIASGPKNPFVLYKGTKARYVLVINKTKATILGNYQMDRPVCPTSCESCPSQF